MASWGLILPVLLCAAPAGDDVGEPDSSASLEWMASTGTNPALRAAVSRALGRLRTRAGLAGTPAGDAAALPADPAAIPLDPLLEALGQPDPVLQALAVEILAEWGDDVRVGAALESLTAADDPMVREAAARSLERVRRSRPVPAPAQPRTPSPAWGGILPGGRTVGALSRPAADTAREQGWGGWLFWAILLAGGLFALLYLVGAMAYYVASGQLSKAMGALTRLVALGWIVAGVILMRSGSGPGRAAGWLGLTIGLWVILLARSFFRPAPPRPDRISDEEPLTGR